MRLQLFRRLLRNVLGAMLGDSRADPRGLLLPWYHERLIENRRAALIISRVRLVAALFAFLTPMWVFVDTLILPDETWPRLAAGRLVATAGFVVLALAWRRSDRLLHAYLALAALFFVPTLFFAYAHMLFAAFPVEAEGMSVSLMAGYAFLPYVIAAGLSVFPLTLVEGLLFALPAVGVQLLSSLYGSGPALVTEAAGMGLLWLLLLIVAIAVLSGMSQLHYLSEIIIKSSHDGLTGAYNRATGEELLEKYYLLAVRDQRPLALVFLDLDNFKSINDGWGHDAGDEVLREVARTVCASIRREDLLIRWGGEEFLLVLPHTGGSGPAPAMRRIAARGLGPRPDGQPVTASCGQADLTVVEQAPLAELVRIADARMYRAKREGKNRLYWGDGEDDKAELLFT